GPPLGRPARAGCTAPTAGRRDSHPEATPGKSLSCRGFERSPERSSQQGARPSPRTAGSAAGARPAENPRESGDAPTHFEKPGTGGAFAFLSVQVDGQGDQFPRPASAAAAQTNNPPPGRPHSRTPPGPATTTRSSPLPVRLRPVPAT